MLSQDDLTGALHDGLKASARCSDTFCRATATIESEGYKLAHNGISEHQTNVTRVHATKTLGMSREQLADRVKDWVTALHDPKAPSVDLNAVLVETRGPAAAGWGWPHAGDHFAHVVGGA